MDSSGEQRRGATAHSNTTERVCAIILAFIFPPLGVFLLRGCNKDLLINVLLTLLLPWIGGMIHAVWIAVADAGAEDNRRRRRHPTGLPVTQPPQSGGGYVAPAPVQQPPYPQGAPNYAAQSPQLQGQSAAGYPGVQGGAGAYPKMPVS